MRTEVITTVTLPSFLGLRSRRLASVALPLAVVATALASCVGSSPGPDPTTAEPTPTAASTPTPSRPVMPEAAKAKTLAGAKEFVTYYYSLVGYGDETHDWEPLKELSLPTCTECKNFWDPTRKRRLDPNKVEIEDVDSITLSDSHATVGVVVTEVEGRRSPHEKYPPRWFDSNELLYKNGAWQVAAIEVIDNGL
jgi:hypothetical protein